MAGTIRFRKGNQKSEPIPFKEIEVSRWEIKVDGVVIAEANYDDPWSTSNPPGDWDEAIISG